MLRGGALGEQGRWGSTQSEVLGVCRGRLASCQESGQAAREGGTDERIEMATQRARSPQLWDSDWCLVRAEAMTTTGTITEAAMPTPVMSEAEIQQLWDEATAFADQSITAWPDVDAFTANDADDIRGADPTASDYCCNGKDASYSYWQQWAEISDYTINVEGVYLSANGAAYEETWPGFWPTDFGVSVPGPRDPAGPSALDVYRFRDGQVVWAEIWYLPDDNELFGLGCFAVDGCPALQDTVDQYVDGVVVARSRRRGRPVQRQRRLHRQPARP